LFQGAQTLSQGFNFTPLICGGAITAAGYSNTIAAKAMQSVYRVLAVLLFTLRVAIDFGREARQKGR
jgi:hypothetical protein